MPKEGCKMSSRSEKGVRLPVIQQRATTCDLCRSIDGRPELRLRLPPRGRLPHVRARVDADRQPIDLKRSPRQPHGTKPRHPSGALRTARSSVIRPRVIRLSRYPASQAQTGPVPIPIATADAFVMTQTS